MEYGEIDKKMFDSIGNKQICDHLINWYNVVDEALIENDIDKLVDLYNNGNVHEITCKMCGSYGYIVNPDSWYDFQGVCHDDDFMSNTLSINGVLVELCLDCHDDIVRLIQ